MYILLIIERVCCLWDIVCVVCGVVFCFLFLPSNVQMHCSSDVERFHTRRLNSLHLWYGNSSDLTRYYCRTLWIALCICKSAGRSKWRAGYTLRLTSSFLVFSVHFVARTERNGEVWEAWCKLERHHVVVTEVLLHLPMVQQLYCSRDWSRQNRISCQSYVIIGGVTTDPTIGGRSRGPLPLGKRNCNTRPSQSRSFNPYHEVKQGYVNRRNVT